MGLTSFRLSFCLVGLLAAAAAPALAFERPDRPYPTPFAGGYTADGNASVEREDTGSGQTHLFATATCTFGDPGDRIWVYGELIGPDSQIWTAKGFKQKQGANMRMSVFHSTHTLLFAVRDVLVPFCKASVAFTDKDGNLFYYDEKDTMAFKLSCEGDLPTAMGLTEDQTAAFLARTGGVREISCKGKVVGEISAGCFRGDTVVATEHGARPIRDIAVGERVWSWDEAAQKKVLSKVTKTFVHPARGLRLVRAGDEVLYTTDVHPFWVEGKGWIKAAELTTGMRLRSEGGEMLAVASNVRTDATTFFAGYVAPAQSPGIRRASLDASGALPFEVVHNIEVDGTHNYFVGKGEVLVHNK